MSETLVYKYVNVEQNSSALCPSVNYNCTSVVYGLLPQDPLQVFGPGFLHPSANSLKRVCVLAFSLSEPDLKTQAAVTAVLGHAYVRCLSIERDNVITEIVVSQH